MLRESAHGPEHPGPVPSRIPEPPERLGPPPGPSATPFKFLDYFEEEEHDSFAGREEEVREALVGLTRGRTYVVYGRSGLGKTSLLLAGVFPLLRQRGFHPMRVRLLESPVADFCVALATELGHPELAQALGDAERLELVPRVLAEHSTREPLVIALDQFEEFFVRFKGRPQEQARLTELLGRIWRERAANIRLVFVIREDYYAQLADLRSALPDLTENGLRLMPLTAYGTRQAVVRPLQHAGVSYEEAFVSRLVDQLAPWLFEPPALQIVCTELYRDVVARRGCPVNLTREDLDRLGGVDGLFRGYVNRVARGLAAERLLLVRVVLDTLIASEARTRRAMRAEDLLTLPVRVELRELREVLEHLTALRLLRVEDRQGERWYELLHEALVSIIEAWLLTDVDYVRFRQARKFVDSLTRDTQWRKDPGWLLSADQLAEGVEPWKQWLRVDAEQAEFLLRSSIHARPDSIGYWAERLDELRAGRSTELLLELSGHSRPETRLAAVVACGHVRDATGQLASRCLSLAMSEREEVMRRAAGSSFARFAGPRAIESLRQELEQRGPSEPLLEVLADLYEAGHRLVGFPLRCRLRIRSLINERTVERHQRSIRHMVRAGVRAALLATAVWCLTVGALHTAYRFCTDLPVWVSRSGLGTFLLVPGALNLMMSLFIGLPAGGLVAWQVTRRACTEMVLHAGQAWTRGVLRSPALMLCCLSMSAIVAYLWLALGQSLQADASSAKQIDSANVLLAILEAGLLSWMMTVGLLWLGSRCIPPNTPTLKVYLWALLSSTFLPTAAEQAVGGVVLRGWAGHSAALWLWVMGLTNVVSSFLSMVLLCALCKGLEPQRGPAQAPRREKVVLARALVVLTIVAAIGGFYFFVGVDTIPFAGRHQLRGELSLRESVWNLADADYTTIQAPRAGTFALSVHGENSPGTRLVINGAELASGSLLISALPDVTAVVIPRSVEPEPGRQEAVSGRQNYHYVLREEPIRPALPEALSTEHWTLVTLQLRTTVKSEGQPSLWQVWIEGQQPLGQRQDITGVQVRPVMLQIPSLPARRCVAILGSSAILGETVFPRDIRTFITPNEADAAVVPPADSRTELLMEDFRLELQEDGRWSLLMTLIPFQEFTPPQCQETHIPLASLRRRGSAHGVKGQESTLTVAIKLY